MRAIVKGFVMWTLGLAVLFGTSAVSSAQPKLKIPRHDECHCTCSYTDAKGKVQQGVFAFWPWPDPKSCKPWTFESRVPCIDNAGQAHEAAASTIANCTLIQGIVPSVPVQPPVAR